MGTPEYMAPEQAVGGDVTAACEWYSVGTILHELLTGTRPFAGTGLQILMAKQSGDAAPVRASTPGAPEDLARLCDALLARAPERRPSGAAVVGAFGGASHATTGSRVHSTLDGGFVGRTHAFDVLDGLLTNVRRGRAEIVVVRGKSGVGKSTLVREFVAQPRVRSIALVLSGRCYERETTPYKALDAVIDALSAHLARPADRASVRAPSDRYHPPRPHCSPCCEGCRP